MPDPVKPNHPVDPIKPVEPKKPEPTPPTPTPPPQEPAKTVDPMFQPPPRTIPEEPERVVPITEAAINPPRGEPHNAGDRAWLPPEGDAK